MTSIATTSGAGSTGKTRLLTIAAAAALASVATVTIAAVASAADVSLEVDDKAIPLSAFPFWTIIATAVGAITARFVRTRRTFQTVTIAATAVSLVPALTFPDDAATRLVLAGIHLVAAAIVIPLLSRTTQR